MEICFIKKAGAFWRDSSPQNDNSVIMSKR